MSFLKGKTLQSKKIEIGFDCINASFVPSKLAKSYKAKPIEFWVYYFLCGPSISSKTSGPIYPKNLQSDSKLDVGR
jgi:hypothetical protein